MSIRERFPIWLVVGVALSGCALDESEDDGLAEGAFTVGEAGDGDTSGGDDPSTGDGDGDSDPSTTGDGDGDSDPSTTGDGDGDSDPTTGDGDGDPDPSTTGDGDGDVPVPNNAYCDPVSDWDADWVAKELAVLELVNQARAQGGNCGSEGSFPASGPLTLDSALICAARVHSLDMAVNNYFDHTNLQGNGPGWRLGQAGYAGNGWGENIAAGYGTPQEVITGWLDSDGHCANMLNPGFSKIGVGYAYSSGSDYGNYWTQTFGG